MKGNYLINF